MSSGGSDPDPVVVGTQESGEAITWDDLDLLTRAFAERQVGLIYSVTTELGSKDATAEQRVAASRLLADFATNMYNIAATENAFTRVLDFCVVTALLEREWRGKGRAEEVFGESGSLLARAFTDAAGDANDLAVRVLNAEQLSSLDRLIDEWTEENELVDRPSFVRISQFAAGRDRPEVDRLLGVGAMFFSSIAETGEAVDRATSLADRVFYRAGRSTTLARWHAAAAKADALATPEIGDALDRLEQLNTRLDDLPARIASEAKSVLSGLDDRLPQINTAIENARGAINEADAMAVSFESASRSIRETIDAGSSLMEGSNASGSGSFDVGRYERAAEGVGAAADRIDRVIGSARDLLGSSDLRQGTGEVQDVVDTSLDAAADRSKEVLNAFFWRAAALIGLFFVLLVIYRGVSIWMLRRYGRGRPSQRTNQPAVHPGTGAYH